MDQEIKNDKKKNVKNIGLGVAVPEKTCDDKNCPFHGMLKTHGRIFRGVVISSRAQKTVTVRIKRLVYYIKYERYGKRDTKIHAHNPECIDAQKGDKVKIMETRPLSKIKNFVVVEKIGKEKLPETEETEKADGKKIEKMAEKPKREGRAEAKKEAMHPKETEEELYDKQ